MYQHLFGKCPKEKPVDVTVGWLYAEYGRDAVMQAMSVRDRDDGTFLMMGRPARLVFDVVLNEPESVICLPDLSNQ